MENIQVSVIVPIYKVERFIERCAKSLFNQTLSDVEFIFVDDASPDRSIEILKECIDKFPERKNSIQLLTHASNKGLPCARNTGLAKARGKYIFHCDSDDYVDLDMLEALYTSAEKHDSDIVWCDFYLSYKDRERYMSQRIGENVEIFLREGLLSGKIKYNVWNKLVKRSLYTENGITFPDGYAMGEDMTMIRLAACAKSVSYVSKAFYHYVQLNTNAYSYSFSDRYTKSIQHNVRLTTNFLHDHYPLNLDKEIAFFKLNTKLPFLISCNWSQYAVWNEWYSESNEYIPVINHQPFRTKAIQWLAWKKCYPLIWIYNIVVYKIIYKLRYH